MKRLVYLAAVAAQALVSLAVLPILTRALPPDQYGTIALIATSQQLLAGVLMLGLAQLVVRAHLRGESTGQGYGTVLAGIALLGLALAPVLRSPEIAIPILAGLVAICGFTSPLLRAQDRVVAWTAMSLVTPVAQVLATMAVVVYPDVKAYLITWVAVMFGTLPLCRYLGDPVWFQRPRLPDLRRLVLVGAPVSFASMGMLVMSSGDRVVVGHVIGRADAGIYQAFYSLGNFSNFAMMALYTFWLNKLMEGDRAAIKRFRLEVVALAFAGAGAAVVGCVILLPDNYDVGANWPIAAIAALSAIPSALTLEFETHLVRMLRTRRLGTTTFTTAIGTAVVTVVVAMVTRNLVAVALVTPGAYLILAARLRWATRRQGPDAGDESRRKATAEDETEAQAMTEPVMDGTVQL